MTDWTDVDGHPGLAVRMARSSSGRMVVAGVRLEAPAVTAEMLRQVPIAAIEKAANGVVPDLPPLRRADHGTAEEFSAMVAKHYRAWAERVANPVTAMAVLAGVRVPTVHSWVREARLRGLLPPASRTKG